MATRNILSALFVSFCVLPFFLVLPTARSLDFIDTIFAVEVTRGTTRDDRLIITAHETTKCSNPEQLRTDLKAECTVIYKTQSTVIPSCFLNCSCLEETPSFIGSEKMCSDEKTFREGCPTVFGSYSFGTGWDWDTNNDSLPLLDISNSYGFMSAFNVSTQAYSTCSLTSMETYNRYGQWNTFSAPSNELTVQFFKHEMMWHISVNTESLSPEKADELEGKFARLFIKCTEEDYENGIITVRDFSSCSIIKIAGNLTYEYNATVPGVSSTTSSTIYLSATDTQAITSQTGLLTTPTTTTPSIVTVTEQTTDGVSPTTSPVITRDASTISTVTTQTSTQQTTMVTGQSSNLINPTTAVSTVASTISPSTAEANTRQLSATKTDDILTTSFATTPQLLPSFAVTSVYETKPSSSTITIPATNNKDQRSHQSNTTTYQISQQSTTTNYITVSTPLTTIPPTSSVIGVGSNDTSTKDDNIGLIMGTVIATSFVVISLGAVALLSWFSQSYRKEQLLHRYPRDNIEMYNIGLYNRIKVV